MDSFLTFGAVSHISQQLSHLTTECHLDKQQIYSDSVSGGEFFCVLSIMLVCSIYFYIFKK